MTDRTDEPKVDISREGDNYEEDDSDDETNSNSSDDEDVTNESRVNNEGGVSDDIGAFLASIAARLRLGGGSDDDQKLPAVLETIDLDGILNYMKEGKAKNIITMAGAGISTSAGIPDFRSPGTGLYDNLSQYNLPNPQAIFDINFFRDNPKPFFHLAKELYPGKFVPTVSHFFVKLLQEKGVLLRHYTQNIDTLERHAGIDGDKLVEAHGSFHVGHCIKCRKEYSEQWMREKILKEQEKVNVPVCTSCNGIVKPDIVFFGENLPERFFRCVSSDFKKCDLLIILGTSLTVQPFASLVDRVGPNVPRLLINKEVVGQGWGGDGLRIDSPNNYRDVPLLGDCDSGCKTLVQRLGWEDQLENLVRNFKKEETKDLGDAKEEGEET